MVVPEHAASVRSCAGKSCDGYASIGPTTTVPPTDASGDGRMDDSPALRRSDISGEEAFRLELNRQTVIAGFVGRSEWLAGVADS